MELYKRDFFIARIQAGYIPVIVNGTRFTIHHPNTDVALFTQERYIQAYEQAQEEGLMTDSDMLNSLITQGIWSNQKEDEYQRIVPEHIDYWKIELYQSTLKSKTREQVRKYLAKAKIEYERLHNIRHHYDYTTDAGYANYVKSSYLISECTKQDGQPVNWDNHNLTAVMGEYHQSILNSESIRLLARTSPWSGLWGILKANGKIFNGDLTTEQQSLISWSRMYDKIYESPDCPNDNVIADDDMLDGWVLLQKRNRDTERKKQEVEGALGGKMQGAGEIFIPAETAEDDQKINLLNSPQIKAIKKHRIKQVKEQGQVKQQEFKDIQLQRSMQMQQAYNQQVKGK